MIPVALITGFLGSGKTTYLRRLAERCAGRKVIFVINEFSRTDVDARLLSPEGDAVVPVPGGSVFCSCLVTAFVQTMTDLPERFAHAESPIEGVIIEASGIANPKVVERMFRETRLDALYALSHIVSVIDPGTFPLLRQSLPNIVAQVEACDAALINKVDLFDETTIAEVEAEVRRIAPDAAILRTNHCDVDLDLFGDRVARGFEGPYAACADPNYARFVAHVGDDFDFAEFKMRLEPLRAAIYRIKGFVRIRGEAQYLDFSPAALTLSPASDANCDEGLVIIARGDAQEAVREFAASLRKGYTP